MTCVLVLLFATAPTLAHLVLPHAQARHAARHDQHQALHEHHHEAAAPDAATATMEQGQAADCLEISRGFCADCSFYCHPAFDIVAETYSELDCSSEESWPLLAIPEGVHPDIRPRPPQLG